MEILNKDKLKAVLEKWKGHPSIAGLMEKFNQLQSYTNKSYKSLETYTKQKIKESKYELVELPYIDVKEDPVRPELTLEFRQKYGRKIFGLKDDEGEIAAIICFAFTDEVPKTVEENKSVNQKIYKEIRTFMDYGAEKYEYQKKQQKQMQEFREKMIEEAKRRGLDKLTPKD